MPSIERRSSTSCGFSDSLARPTQLLADAAPLKPGPIPAGRAVPVSRRIVLLAPSHGVPPFLGGPSSRPSGSGRCPPTSALARIVRKRRRADACDTLPLAVLSGFAARHSGVPACFMPARRQRGLLDRLAPALCSASSPCPKRTAHSAVCQPMAVRLVYTGHLAEQPSPQPPRTLRGATHCPNAPLVGYAGSFLQPRAWTAWSMPSPWWRLVAHQPSAHFMAAASMRQGFAERVRLPGSKQSDFPPGHLSDIGPRWAPWTFSYCRRVHRGLSRVIIEAMACARPVIATARAGTWRPW